LQSLASGILLALAFVTPSWGHVVLTDGTIGVTMHIDPDDAPVAGKPSRFYLWFKDTSGHLDPARCRGTFTVTQGDVLVSNQPLFAQAASGLISVHEVTFGHAGVYTVRVNGASLGVVSFQPFLLTFSVRVSPGEPTFAQAGFSWVAGHAWALGLGVLSGGLILWWGLRPLPSRKKP
jgi:hypothetical protein